jgi:hypothetical protein
MRAEEVEGLLRLGARHLEVVGHGAAGAGGGAEQDEDGEGRGKAALPMMGNAARKACEQEGHAISRKPGSGELANYKPCAGLTLRLPPPPLVGSAH